MKLSNEIVTAAFDRLFPNAYLNPDFCLNSDAFNEFKRYVNMQFSKLHCVVLWKRSSSFSEFLEKYGLDCGKREVIITDNDHMRFSNNWVKEPRAVF